MPCPDCGNEHTFPNTEIIHYGDVDGVMRLKIDTITCFECGCFEVLKETLEFIPMPERDPNLRYYIEFDCDEWYIIDSLDEDVAEDSSKDFDEALSICKELNEVE